MFHQIKVNIKKSSDTMRWIGIVFLVLAGYDMATGPYQMDWPGLFHRVLQAAASIGAVMLCAVVRTLWELTHFHYKRLCAFFGALRKFCRDYWSNQVTAA